MKNSEKKILFLDMDGTTLDDSHRISGENREALRKVAEAGHEIVITTGRPAASAGYLLKTYGLEELGCHYVIAFNGGIILDCRTGKTLFSRTMPLEHVRYLIKEARIQGLYLQTYEGDHVLSERADENLEHYVNKTSMKSRVVPDLLKALTEEPYKVLAVDVHDHDRMEAFRERTKAWAENRVDMFFSCREYMEIVPKGICKGEALRAFCELEGVSLSHAIAAGDENNDLTMIREAGIGCAVANAVPAVKEAADYVTVRDNNHSAIAEIAERFLLN